MVISFPRIVVQTMLCKDQRLCAWNGAQSGFRSGFMLRNLDCCTISMCNMMHPHSTPTHSSPSQTDIILSSHSGCRVQMAMGQQCPASSEGYVEYPTRFLRIQLCFVLLGETTPEIWMRKLDWIAGAWRDGPSRYAPGLHVFRRVAADGKGVSRCLIPRVPHVSQNQVCRRILAWLSRRSSGTRHPIRSSRASVRKCDELASPKNSPAARQNASQSCSSRTILRILGLEERPRHLAAQGASH